jgi:gliding motility-associated-like protein
LPLGGNSVAGSSLVAGSYTANVTDSLGCAASATVSISEPQPLNLSVDSLKNVSCSGKNDGYLSVVAYGGTPAYSYSWSVAQTGTFITQLQAGAYTVTVKDTNNCAASLVASVTQPPVLSVSVAAIQNALCFSALGGASLTTSGGTAPYSYTWSTTPPQNGSNLQNAPAGNYSVSIADMNGCPQTLSLNISQPSQVITSVTQPDTLCADNPYNLVATATGGAGDYYFSWEPAGAVNAGTLAITPATPVVYTVVAFDKNGCAGTDGISVIRLFDLKKSDLKLLGYTPICPGQTSILEVQTSGNTGPLSYSWNNNLPATPGLHVVAPSKTTNYVVTVSNTCGRSIIDTITVAINDPPVVQLEADTLKTCVPGAIRFNETAGAINASDPVISWTWDFGDGNVSAEQDPVHQYLNPGTYTVSVSVVSDRGCQGKSKAPVLVQVYPQPVAAFTLNSTSLDLPYDLLKATNQSSGAVSYFWNFGNEQTSSLTNPEVLLKGVGDTRIQLIAISQFGCSDTTDIIISTNADVVFPTAFTPSEDGPNGGYYQLGNLSNDVFFPYTSGVVDYHLQIFNRWGELVFESRDVNIGWDGYYRGKLSQLGVYVWKAEVKLINDRVFKQSGNLTLIR